MTTISRTDDQLGDEALDELSTNQLTVATFVTEVVTIDPEATVAEAAAALAAADRGLLVVGTVEAVEGVMSERDVVRALGTGRDVDSLTLRELETTRLIWCDSNASIADVAEQMLENYVRHVLVEEDGQLVGVVSARDLLGAYVSGA